MPNECYCNTCQQPKNIPELKFSFSDKSICIEQNQIVTANAHNAVIEELKKIYNYGSKGSRTMPKSSVLNLQNVSISDIYTADMYNALLETIDDSSHTIQNKIGAIQDQTYITGYYFRELEDYINNIKIDANRCASCNDCNSCNTCQGYNPCDACYIGCQGCNFCDTEGGCSYTCEAYYDMCTHGLYQAIRS